MVDSVLGSWRGASDREWYRPNPPLPTVRWSLRNNVNYQQSVSVSPFTFTVRTIIAGIDDPADGQGAQDQNGNTVDYKRVILRISCAGVSLKPKQSAFRPCIIPCVRKWQPSSVFPVPEAPRSNVVELEGNPPRSISSR